MGYTHYYEVLDIEAELKVAEIGRDLAEVIRRCEVPIGDADGAPGSSPQTHGRRIAFNGIKPEACDDFTYPPMFELNPALGLRKGYAYCKTRRYSYDIVVCVSMLVIKHHLGDGARLSSEGRRNELGWSKAIALHDYIFRDRDGEKLVGEIRGPSKWAGHSRQNPTAYRTSSTTNCVRWTPPQFRRRKTRSPSRNATSRETIAATVWPTSITSRSCIWQIPHETASLT